VHRQRQAIEKTRSQIKGKRLQKKRREGEPRKLRPAAGSLGKEKKPMLNKAHEYPADTTGLEQNLYRGRDQEEGVSKS